MIPATVLLIILSGLVSCNPQYVPLEDIDPVRLQVVFPQNEEKLRLSFVGDIMAHRENYRMKDYRAIWLETAPVFLNDDFSFGNLEFVVDPSKPRSTFPRFNIDPLYVETAIKAGMDVFSLANNHTADQGAASMQATLSVMEGFRKRYEGRRPLYFSGIFREDNEYLSPVYWTCKGIKIAFLAVTQFSNRGEGLERMNLVSYKHNPGAKEQLIARVREAKEQADLVILSFHAGKEYLRVPEKDKHDFFRQLLVVGADIIWAHHPHVLQPWRKYTLNGSDKLVMYSLGNFISGQGYYIDPREPAGRQYRGESGIMQVEVRRESGKLAMQVSAIPVVTYTHPVQGIIVKRYDALDKFELPPVWKNYYQGRKEELYGMLRINHQ
ncbi:MAG: CapA family protein [Spirochaetales bacterium]|nr:CapA family protein [Spirochaetales bacterium]